MTKYQIAVAIKAFGISLLMICFVGFLIGIIILLIMSMAAIAYALGWWSLPFILILAGFGFVSLGEALGAPSV